MLLLLIFVLVSGSLCENVNTAKSQNVRLIPEPIVPQLDGRIVGGHPTNISNHPHQASLNSWHRHNCGASLIAPDWMLTAAHCLSGVILQYTFRLGSHLWGEGGVLIAASKIIIHPLYNGSNFDYDIALVKVSNYQSEVGDTIRYAQLPPDGWQPTPGSMATITGWGFPWPQGSLMDELQEVDAPIVSNESCQEYYWDWSVARNIYITDRMLCAGFADGGFDACQGDSGGPLLVDGYLTGVVSWGNGCALAGFPGVYASVPNLLPWIKEHTGLL